MNWPDGVLKVEPNPAKPGQEVEVTYLGPNKVRWRTSGDWQQLPIDPKTKKGRFRIPKGVPFVTVSDLGDPPSNVLIEVVNTGS